MSDDWKSGTLDPTELHEIVDRFAGPGQHVLDTMSGAVGALLRTAVTSAFMAGIEHERQRLAAGGAEVPPTFGDVDDEPPRPARRAPRPDETVVFTRPAQIHETTIIPQLNPGAGATFGGRA